MHAALGGDFYDVEVGRDGGLFVVLGDVVGHGLDATVAMAQLQAATRTAGAVAGSIADIVDVPRRTSAGSPNCVAAQTPPLAFPGAVRRSHRHDEPVAGVVFATDGLIERRADSADDVAVVVVRPDR